MTTLLKYMADFTHRQICCEQSTKKFYFNNMSKTSVNLIMKLTTLITLLTNSIKNKLINNQNSIKMSM